jgi:hypothetical protein
MQDAYSIFQSNGTDEAKLREVIASIQGQIAKRMISGNIKNTALSGDPRAGSVKVSRLMGSTVQDYGTARSGGAGNKISDNYVTVPLDTDKEIVEEVNKFDLRQYGVDGILEKRAESIAFGFASHMDSAFFTEAEAEGTEVTASGDTIADRLMNIISNLEKVSNDNVDGVPKEMIRVSLSVDAYNELQGYLDTLPNPVEGGVRIETFHGVRVYPTVHQTEEAIVQAVGAIAAPTIISDIDFGKIPLSNEMGITFFFNYGVEAVMSDLIFYGDIISEAVSA